MSVEELVLNFQSSSEFKSRYCSYGRLGFNFQSSSEFKKQFRKTYSINILIFQSSSEFKRLTLVFWINAFLNFQSSSEFKRCCSMNRNRYNCTFNPLLSLRKSLAMSSPNKEGNFQSSSEFKGSMTKFHLQRYLLSILFWV